MELNKEQKERLAKYIENYRHDIADFMCGCDFVFLAIEMFASEVKTKEELQIKIKEFKGYLNSFGTIIGPDRIASRIRKD